MIYIDCTTNNKLFVFLTFCFYNLNLSKNGKRECWACNYSIIRLMFYLSLFTLSQKFTTFTQFYTISHIFTRIHTISHPNSNNFIKIHILTHKFRQFQTILHKFRQFQTNSHNFTRIHTISHSKSTQFRTLSSFTRIYTISHNCTQFQTQNP